MGWFAIDHFYPKWDVWSRFTSECLQSALTLDSMQSSHPIEVEVNDPLDIAQIFDVISYLKGSSCIRMLVNHLGIDVFFKVIHFVFAKNRESDYIWKDINMETRTQGTFGTP
jgi:aminopeptidase N